MRTMAFESPTLRDSFNCNAHTFGSFRLCGATLLAHLEAVLADGIAQAAAVEQPLARVVTGRVTVDVLSPGGTAV